MGARRLAALVAGLPPGCATHRAQDPDGYGASWGNVEELLALLIEITDRHDRHFVIANSRKNARKPRAFQIPRPRDRRGGRKRNATGDELARMVKGLGGARVADPGAREATRNGG